MTTPTPLPVVVPVGAVPLTPAQTRFNQLVRQIGQAREALTAWQDGIAAFRVAHAKHIAPLETELDRVRRERVTLLDALSHREGLARLERETLSELIAREAYALLIETPDSAELRTLFAAHAGVDFARAQRPRRDAAESADDPSQDHEPGRKAGHGRHSHDAEDRDTPARDTEFDNDDRDATPDDGHGHRPPPRPARRTAAQRKRNAEAQQALQSLRDVYRKLAGALHPDREPDASKHAAKTALMQRVNRAYEARDLLALLELQLEIEQVDLKGLASAGTQRLKLYNAVLADQLESLKAAARDTQAAFCAEFGLRDDLTLNPRKLEPLIRALRAELQALVRQHTLDRRQLADLDAVRRWLKAERKGH